MWTWFGRQWVYLANLKSRVQLDFCFDYPIWTHPSVPSLVLSSVWAPLKLPPLDPAIEMLIFFQVTGKDKIALIQVPISLFNCVCLSSVLTSSGYFQSSSGNKHFLKFVKLVYRIIKQCRIYLKSLVCPHIFTEDIMIWACMHIQISSGNICAYFHSCSGNNRS